MGSAPANRLGIAGGVLNMTRSIGTSLGVAATGAVLAVRLAARLGGEIARTTDAPLAALVPSLHEALLFLAVLALGAAVLSATRGGQPAVHSQGASAARVHVEGRL